MSELYGAEDPKLFLSAKTLDILSFQKVNNTFASSWFFGVGLWSHDVQVNIN